MTISSLRAEGCGLKLAICVAGLPGSGKTLVSEAARKLGFKVIVMGDAVRQEAMKRGVPLTREGLGSLMLRLREEMGAAAVAKLCLMQVSPDDDVVVFEGTRSLAEVEAFKQHFNHVVIVAVHASPRLRYERLKRRGRSDDPSNWSEFVERDLRELKVGLGEVIALADYMIVNEESPTQAFSLASKILRELSERVEAWGECR